MSFISSAHGYGQGFDFFRGHDSTDLYVFGRTAYSSSNYNIIHFINYGGTIQIENNHANNAGNYSAEKTPGKIFGHAFDLFYSSVDYGKTVTGLSVFVNDYTTIDRIYGGEIPGDYIVEGSDCSIYMGPCGVIYKTFDSFQHFTFVADSQRSIHFGEPGMISGELFQIPTINGQAFLSHSLDYGATYDTIPISSSVVNLNMGVRPFVLSRGTQRGELFLVTQDTTVSSNVQYKIYHSNNYGTAWDLKSTHVFDSASQNFTAGRKQCSFYMANLKATPNSDFFTLQIYYSSDCGVTFQEFEYLLSPDVGTAELKSTNDEKIRFSPNPANGKTSLCFELAKTSSVSIECYDELGKCIWIKKPETIPAGTVKKSIDIEDFHPGCYFFKIKIDNQKVLVGKLSIAR